MWTFRVELAKKATVQVFSKYKIQERQTIWNEMCAMRPITDSKNATKKFIYTFLYVRTYVSFRYYQSSVQRVHQRPSITTQPMCVDTPRERKLVSCLFVCLVVWLWFVLFFFSARYTLLYTNITQSLLDCVFDGDDDGDDDVHSRMKVCFWTTLFATHSTICHVSYFRTFSFSLHRHVLR